MESQEQALLRRFVLHNDGEAFAALSDGYAGLVYRVCWRVLRDEHKAADAAQETFLQFVRHAHMIRGSLAGWLHRVATGKAIDILRRDKRQERTSLERLSDPAVAQQDWQELSVHLDEALNELDHGSRELLIEHYLEGRSMREVANRKGISQATVSRKVNAALKQLRDRLGAPALVLTPVILGGILSESSAQVMPAVLVRTLRKIGMSGGGASLGPIGKTAYLVSHAGWPSKMIAVAALVIAATVPTVHYVARKPQPHVVLPPPEIRSVGPGDSPPPSVVTRPRTTLQRVAAKADDLMSGPKSSGYGAIPPVTRQVPKVTLVEPVYYYYFAGPEARTSTQRPAVSVKFDTPHNTIRTFVGLLGQQDPNGVDRCFVPGSNASTHWQRIRQAETPQLTDLRQILFALDSAVEFTEIWQEYDRVGVTWLSNVTKELELKALGRRFIPWDIYTLQVELQYANGQWLINELWSE
jgi:RNA polymerase sigma factor (sigma-70 family)